MRSIKEAAGDINGIFQVIYGKLENFGKVQNNSINGIKQISSNRVVNFSKFDWLSYNQKLMATGKTAPWK